ncbi:MAG TPA: sensor histidine kinase [Nitrosomonas nitrosa]|jgi:two-component system sensor histidine kinase RegB|uniref:histidine kinase n=1 Tax=Nitrosomonas nitrosa TaxID=52442 RepID=A0A1I4KT87_9PROT|nr:ATP-binding protein [Nitrosomonas nitrosa]MCO6432973.1 HAMP domain-containing histidine kinase [Nitrosomonas nitrosa]PTQ92828.1 two-component system sensor histidine kinase RegB [Nitrosomonas nitrosa]CAE6512706.1 Two-component system, sensor histidine kinase RegB [Nitrosomonas nitrosa]SFL81994.1 two-component system, sensor histidine kinase RegB [Nitrosomonas nitrosa]HBZ29485.1 sensor histidine kinase [Nitrosomonas nitrosa]
MFNIFHQSPLSKNLQRLFFLRSIAIVVQCILFVFVYSAIEIEVPWTEMTIVVVILSLLNFFTWVRLHHTFPVSNLEFFAQLLIDIFALTALLYLSGGSTNPFISLYLLPLTIAAAILPWRYTWAIAGITITCYTILLFEYIPLPHDHSDDHSAHLMEFNLHISGMWLTFVLSTILIAWFVVKMSSSIRDRDKDLAQAREQALRNEQIIALGTLAAGAAHELGTPLSTMAVIAGELQREFPQNEEFQNNIQILRNQITHCKQTLTQLLANAGQARVEDGNSQPVDYFLKQILTKWQLIRPSTKFNYLSDGVQPVPRIMNTQLLSQSILNLLNNAADASTNEVKIKSHWDQQMLNLEIHDDGEGLTKEAMQRAGEAFFTSKAPGQGFGIGLFLANANIERFGGSVRLFNHPEGGACIHVSLPLIS